MRLRKKKIQELVDRLLASSKVKKPPVPVDKIAEKLGLTIESHHFDKQEFSGVLVREGERAVVGINVSHHPNRQRFSIAHEVGHYLLHAGDRVFVDRVYNVNLRSSVSSLGTDLEEIEANTFASLLLIPESFLMNDPDASSIDMEDEQAIRKLARKYQVSSQAMTFRLLNRATKIS